MTIDDLIKKNKVLLEHLKRDSGEPEVKNYSYYKGKQDAHMEVLNEMLKIYKRNKKDDSL